MSATFRSNDSSNPTNPSGPPTDMACVIGKSVKCDGDITSDEPVTIHGQVKGKIKINHTLTIGRDGLVFADINAREVIVMGRAEGTIRVEHKVTIMEGGQVTGDIHSDKIIIQEGAIFQGNVNMEEKSGK